MQLNNPIFINQTDADVRYVNTINNQNINGVKTFANSGIFSLSGA
jgi:hypothetical protein